MQTVSVQEISSEIDFKSYSNSLTIKNTQNKRKQSGQRRCLGQSMMQPTHDSITIQGNGKE